MKDKITPTKLKNKVWSIITAERGIRGYVGIDTIVFTMPVGSTVYVNRNYRAITQKGNPYILTSDAKIRMSCFSEFGINGYTSFSCKQKGVKEADSWYNSFRYQPIRLDWKDIISQPKILKELLAWVEKKTPHFTAKKVKGVITFTNKKTKEKLHCDLGKQKFSRTYLKGKDREIRYPAQFFKHVSGRALINTLNDPNASTFTTLVDLVADKYAACRNFGTFLVKMFDHQHLEQYISAGVRFEFDIPFKYTDFSKDIRNKLNEHNIIYTQDVGALFCSDIDTGRAVFAQIKDCKGFQLMVKMLSHNIQALNTLINHYNYDLKRVFEYCSKLKWQSGLYRNYYGNYRDYQKLQSPEDLTLNEDEYFDFYRYDLVGVLRDYARMAIAVYGDNYDKYPDNLKEAHDECETIYKLRQQEIDEKQFIDTIDKSLEWKSKDFVVIYPKKPEDVINEGKKLRHCVGSYIQSVIKGECKIIFLRQKETPDVPFVTLEVSGGNIRQARGVGNSSPTYDARMALKDYAKEKKLLYTG